MSSDANVRIDVEEAKQFIAVYLAFAAPAAVVYIITIALILVTKTYRQFLQRLRLYLALAGLVHAAAIGLEVLPADISQPANTTVEVKRGWDWACMLFGAFGQYCSVLQTLVTAWISFYVFMLVAFHEQLKQRRHEAVGLFIVVSAPILLTWEPFIQRSYGLMGASCWISDGYGRNASLGSKFVIAVSLVPNTLMTLVSILLLTAANVLLIKGALRRSGYLRRQNWKALKEILPLMLYPTAYCLSFIVDLILIAADVPDAVIDATTVSLIQLCSLALLVSLFLHVNFLVHCRRACSCRGSQHVILPAVPSISDTTVGCKNVQQAEKDALISSA